MSTIRCYLHNKVKVLDEAGKKGQFEVPLKFQDGRVHVLHSNGQQTRATPKDRSLSPRQRRKQEKAARRNFKP